MIESVSQPDLLALLAWYREMGVDCAVGDEPVNWLELGERAPGASFRARDAGDSPPTARTAEPPPAAPRPSPPVPTARAEDERERRFRAAAPDAAETTARIAARSATTISELEEAIRRFEGCGLKATAKNTCVYRGAAKARVMIIGEAPGRDEDLEGKPFVGRAGQLLDRMLHAISFGEKDVHITNIVYWRPPGNRTPTPQEAQVCRPFLERQAELVAPDIVVLLGGAAAKHILNATDGIMKLRGKWRDISLGQQRAKAIATLHPAYLLRTPAAKRLAWLDLLAIRAELDKMP